MAMPLATFPTAVPAWQATRLVSMSISLTTPADTVSSTPAMFALLPESLAIEVADAGAHSVAVRAEAVYRSSIGEAPHSSKGSIGLSHASSLLTPDTESST